jgi:hypothetical protein
MNQEEFLDAYKEHMEMISKALENLSKRQEVIETAMGRMPQPGADMLKYKPEGYQEDLNLRELLDDLYVRLNMLEERIKVLEP